MKRSENFQKVYLKDGYTFCAMIETDSSVWDPGHQYPIMAQSFRVVSQPSSSTLVLVPIGEPSLWSRDMFKPEDIESAEESIKRQISAQAGE